MELNLRMFTSNKVWIDKIIFTLIYYIIIYIVYYILYYLL